MSPLALVMLASPASGADYENVLLILADDLGTDKVGAYAADVVNPAETRPATPTIDLLADAGVRFSDAWSMPTCSPTRATLLTGDYPWRTGIGAPLDSAGELLPIDPVTLQQLAAESGLQTGIFGKWHLGRLYTGPVAQTPTGIAEYPVETGFGTFQGSLLGQVEGYTDWIYVQSLADAASTSGYTTSVTNTTVSATEQTTADALAWIQTQHANGRRWLGMLAYNLPHNTDNGPVRNWADAVRSCGLAPSGSDTDDFGLAVTCLDAELWELLTAIPDLEHTLVIFMGDNGSPPGVAQGQFADGRGKETVYESGIRVPFVFVDGAALDATLNGSPAVGPYVIDTGTVVEELVGVVDVYATLADYLGLDASICTPGSDCARDSVSLRPALAGGAAVREVVWSERFAYKGSQYTGAAALRIGDFKLVVSVPENEDPCRQLSMYNLVTDRYERQDVFPEPRHLERRLALIAALQPFLDNIAGTEHNWTGHATCCAEEEAWYDGIDRDCDGASDFDQDADGSDSAEFGGADCDDTDPTIRPDAGERWYDGIDQDCDGADDFDQDADGSGDVRFGGLDCDDTDPELGPHADEIWYDAVDQDCDRDNENDQDADGDDAVAYGGSDCDDTDPAVQPGAIERWYDGIDQDCDGANDLDADGDGYDSAEHGGDDCDDDDAEIHPGAIDPRGDDLDANCDGIDKRAPLDDSACGCGGGSWLLLPALGLTLRRRSGGRRRRGGVGE